MQMAYQSIHVYTFPETFTCSTHRRWSLIKNSQASPAGETATSFGVRRFLCRQAPNHKHLREPAARGAAATTFVMTLPAPQVPALQVPSCSLATGHASERASHCSSSVGHAHSPAVLGQLCLWSLRSAGNTSSRRSSFWKITHL